MKKIGNNYRNVPWKKSSQEENLRYYYQQIRIRNQELKKYSYQEILRKF